MDYKFIISEYLNSVSGGGSVANNFHNLNFKVDAVKPDERIVDVAHQYFFAQSGCMGSFV